MVKYLKLNVVLLLVKFLYKEKISNKKLYY